MRALTFLTIVATLTLSGCQAAPDAEADPATYALGSQFDLPGGQKAVVGDDDFTVRFDDVLEDSRCPTKVECVWTGQARIAVTAEGAGANATTVEFNTNPAPGQGVTTATVGPYTVELLRLDPYPETPEQSIPLDEYRAKLTVRRI